MSKTYLIQVVINKDFAVTIDDGETQEDAEQYVLAEVMEGGDIEIGVISLAKNETEVENFKRHADEII